MSPRNKSIAFFLFRFFGTYIVLFMLYSLYLNKTQVREGLYKCAPMTSYVAKSTVRILNFLEYDSRIEQSDIELSLHLLVREDYVARVIEGCNAMSIIILFVSFIVGFATSFKSTLLYILGGSFIIYMANVVRIAAISIALFEFPNYEYILHDLVFPTLIYGLTFLLWFIWIRLFYRTKK